MGAQHLRRKEQDFVSRIIHGKEAGHYFMILGSKVIYFQLTSRQMAAQTRERREPVRQP